MPKLTGPIVPAVPMITPPPSREPEGRPALQFGGIVGSFISPLVEPIQSLAAGFAQAQHDYMQNRDPPGRGGKGYGNPLGGLLPGLSSGLSSLQSGLASLNPFQYPKSGGPQKEEGNKNPLFGQTHIKCSPQEVSCSFLREAAYQMQNDDDHCLKIATSFDQEGKIKFEPLAQDADNVIYGITTDGLTASAWCNDIGWALRRIYNGCRRGKQCFGGKQSCSVRDKANILGDSYAARNSAFMVTVGPRDKSPRINVQVTRFKDSSRPLADLLSSTEDADIKWSKSLSPE
jgi:hypothetical protein